MQNGSKKYQNFHFQNIQKLDFLVRKYTIWQPFPGSEKIILREHDVSPSDFR
jgi:hypothetical protein